MKKFLNTLSMISVLFAMGVTILILFWEFYPYQPLVLNKPTFPMITKTVYPGNLLTYQVDYCKYMNLSAMITRHVINGYDYTMPTVLGDKTTGCGVSNISFTLPKETPSGVKYKLEIIYKYQVNPLREIVVKEVTDPFTVLVATNSATVQ